MVKRRQLLVAAAAALTAGCAPRVAATSPTRYPAELTGCVAGGVPLGVEGRPNGISAAAANDEALRYIPCYSGCGLLAGHLNNYDC